SRKPEMTNFSVGGFGRLATPDAWLSTWSGVSSNAALDRSLKGITIPTLVIEYTGDCSVYPSDIRTTLDSLAAEDVTHVKVRCDHFAQPLDRGEPGGTAPTVAHLLAWAGARA